MFLIDFNVDFNVDFNADQMLISISTTPRHPINY